MVTLKIHCILTLLPQLIQNQWTTNVGLCVWTTTNKHPLCSLNLCVTSIFHSIVFFVSFKVQHQGGRRRTYSYPGFLSQIDHVIGIGCEIVYHLPTRLYNMTQSITNTIQSHYRYFLDTTGAKYY
jgi:hypothetical protein